MSFKNGVSVSPSPVEVLQSNPTRLQSLILWEFLLPLPDSQVGKPDVRLRTFTPVGGPLWCKCLPQLVSHPPSGYGIWFYCDCTPPTISLWLLLCLWTWGIFFGEFQCLPVNDCSAVNCDSSAVARGMGAHPSTPSSWTNLQIWVLRRYWVERDWRKMKPIKVIINPWVRGDEQSTEICEGWISRSWFEVRDGGVQNGEGWEGDGIYNLTFENRLWKLGDPRERADVGW